MATYGFYQLNGPVHVRWFADAGSSVFVAGDPVILSSGVLTIATSSAKVWGIALANSAASATTANTVPVALITPEQEWVAYANATTAKASHVGNAYDLTISKGANYVNLSGTTTACFCITALDPRDGAHTGSGGRVIGKFDDACIESMGI